MDGITIDYPIETIDRVDDFGTHFRQFTLTTK